MAMGGACENETYEATTGFSPWVQFLYEWEQWQLHDIHWVARWIFLSILAMPALCFAIIGVVVATANISFVQVAAAVIGCLIWKKRILARKFETSKGTNVKHE